MLRPYKAVSPPCLGLRHRAPAAQHGELVGGDDRAQVVGRKLAQRAHGLLDRVAHGHGHRVEVGGAVEREKRDGGVFGVAAACASTCA